MLQSNSNYRRPLSSKQEKRLVDYLDQQFLELTRNFKKRSDESSHLQTLSAYIDAAKVILAFILQIPPLDPSTGLRIAYLLHLTGDVFNSMHGYSLGETDLSVHTNLENVLDFLDDIDQAWVTVLKGQVWDPESGEGVDLYLPVDNDMVMESSGTVASPLKSSPPSQTDVARLRSLLLVGESTLEEWLANPHAEEDPSLDENDLGNITGMLSRIGLLNSFDSLFYRTLDFLPQFISTADTSAEISVD